MRILLLLSAFLTALIGPVATTGVAARTPTAACAMAQRATKPLRAHVVVVAAASMVRVAPVTDAPPPSGEAPTLPVARYALRLRV